ncbi:hypothetical protein CGH11_13000 [Vibrio parahaemolyticus]|uniref:hypothetical protein n=1 Tax=Vibrio parahaemolyticus TaxID=670 RepID=UPI00111D38C1|nr:hypothetical protein [Vibrio parahaemolyticus]TOP71768.1 hypothetical protein CGH11_13000 [Vibrio parahaemolyticus]
MNTSREVGYYWVRFGRQLREKGLTREWIISFWDGSRFKIDSDDWPDEVFDCIDEDRLDPPAHEIEKNRIVFSMDGYRRQLSEDVKELRDIVKSIITDGYDMEPSDLADAMNNIICKSNAFNCVSLNGCDSFSDLSDIEVDLIDLEGY